MIHYSVIIPHYNSLDTLPRTLNSIPARDDVEVFVIDNSPVPIKKEQIEGVNREYELLYSPYGKGAGAARNVGLDKAKGKWIIYADSDDFFTEEFDAVLDKYIDVDADAVMFPIRNVVSETLEPSDRDMLFNERVFNDKLSARQKFEFNMWPWSKFVRSDFVKNNSIRNNEDIVSNDVVFNASVAALATRFIIDKDHCIYTAAEKINSLSSQLSDDRMYVRVCIELKRRRIWKSSPYRNEMAGVDYVLPYLWHLTSFKYWMLSTREMLRCGELINLSLSESVRNIRSVLGALRRNVLKRK